MSPKNRLLLQRGQMSCIAAHVDRGREKSAKEGGVM